MKIKLKLIASVFLLVIFIITWGGCSAGTPVRHLSSDVCLVMPERTTKKEVLSFLGEPDNRKIEKDQTEIWLYYKVNESFLRKIPLVGKNLGSLDYETVTVTFRGDLVTTCLYRQFDEQEFEGISDQVVE